MPNEMLQKEPRAPVIDLIEVHKIYRMKAGEVHALRGISFKVFPGEFMSIMGQSGSGKSTLLHVLGCLHQVTSGRYVLDGEDVSGHSDASLSVIRNRKIGFIFQKFNLLPQEDIVQNVALPLVYAGYSTRRRNEIACEKLNLVGLGDRLHHKPSELSGGQSQRVAIARALVTDPAILLADEPTGNLDSQTGEEIMGVFQALHLRGCTILQVTHDREKAEYTDRVVLLKDGLIEREERIQNPRKAEVSRTAIVL